MHAVAAPAETPAITRGRNAIAGGTTSQKPACHQQRLPPPAKTTCSNGVGQGSEATRGSDATRGVDEGLGMRRILSVAARVGRRPRPVLDSTAPFLPTLSTMTHPVPGLRLIACGGTFDKRYDPLRGEVTTIKRYKEEGCGRLAVKLTQPNTPTKQGTKTDFVMIFELNLCQNGMPPRDAVQFQ